MSMRAILLVVALLVSGCAAPPRVVSFGDSLSDLGTYAERTEGRTAARFTTNPGPVWIELVAQELGTTIGPNRRAGWGKPVMALGGTAYGEGGSRVALQPGSNNTDATAGPGSTQTTLPVREQVDAYLAGSQGRFRAGDIVFVWAGANDLFRHGFFTPVASEEAGNAPVREAAHDLAIEVKRIVAAGAPRVVVLNLQDWGQVPASRQNARGPWLTAWSALFNDELAQSLRGVAGVTLIDIHALMRSVVAEPAKHGFKNAQVPACRIPELPNRSVLFCTPDTLVEPDAHLSYLFADGVHPTTAGHRLVAREVMSRLKQP